MNIDLKHESHNNVYSRLRQHRLNYFIAPYKQLIYSIPPNVQKKIFFIVKDDKYNSKKLQNKFIEYFNKYKIAYEIKDYNKNKKDTTVKNRVKKYSDKQKENNRKLIKFYVDDEFYEKINNLKNEDLNSYDKVFLMLYNHYYSSRFK